MQEKIRKELTESMRARDSLKTSVLRGLLAAFTNELIAKGRKPEDKLSDEEMLAVIKRGVKQRKDSIEQFQKGGRQDLVDKETAEMKMLEAYLPAQMPRQEIEKIAKQLKEKMGVTDKSKTGQFMGSLMKELKGQADGAVVKEIVEDLFK